MPTTHIDSVTLKKEDEFEIILPSGHSIYVYGNGEVAINNYANGTHFTGDYTTFEINVKKALKKKIKKNATQQAKPVYAFQ
jgi:hypothetical protein